ncbi:MAG: hypothetical protein E6J41_00735 [Chloroflexi bacterium]|nr:MAG: hypothetical protein E6J41_00735 [Chloroflexota bacterium]
MLVLYSAVFVSGVLLVLPVRGRPYADLVDLHLLTSVWALPLTTWHVWHYRARALPYVRRWASRLAGRRFWTGVALVALPMPVLAADAPAVSQLPAVLGGASWTPVGALRGAYLDAIAQAPDGTLVAAGDALYLSRDGVVWLRVDLPVTSAAPAAAAPSGGHQHGPAAPPNPITALAAGQSRVFAGTAQGLFASGFAGPLQQVAFPGGGVRGLAMAGDTLWAASAAGPMVSRDGGRSWAAETAGLSRPADAAAIAYVGRDVFVSDTTGVFAWRPGAAAWERTSSMPGVTRLSPAGGALYASSETTTDLRVLAAGRWTDLGLPAPVHVHHGEVHGQAATVLSADGRLYAAGTPEGVSASADGGWTWTQLGGGLGDGVPGQAVARQGSLWAATSGGLYRFPLAPGGGATASWWAMVLALALGLGVVAAAVSGLDPRRRRGRER